MQPYTLVPKHLLPYKGKAVISHVIEAYPRSSVFHIVVHPSDKLTKNYLVSMHPDRKINYIESVNPHRGNPLYDLDHALDKLHKHSRVFITVADGVYQIPDFTHQKNWLGVKSVPISMQVDYGNVVSDEDYQFLYAVEKRPVAKSSAWVGLVYIESVNTAHNALKVLLYENRNPSFSDWFNELAKCLETIKVVEVNNWVDLGTAHKYKASLPEFDWSKPDQITYMSDTRVCKFFADFDTAVSFYTRRAAFPLSHLLPKVELEGHFVSWPKMEGTPAYKTFTQTHLNLLLDRMSKQCWPIPSVLEGAHLGEAIRLWPLTKAQERRETYLEHGTHQEFTTINGVPIDHNWWFKIENYASRILRMTFQPAQIHGDLTLDNILVQPNGDIGLLDWRPLTNGQNSQVGDLHYDIAKLVLSCMVNFQSLRAGQFTFIVEGDRAEIGMPTDTRLQRYAEVIADRMSDLDTDVIKLHVILQLVSMAGVHREPFASIFYTYAAYLANCFD